MVMRQRVNETMGSFEEIVLKKLRVKLAKSGGPTLASKSTSPGTNIICSKD